MILYWLAIIVLLTIIEAFTINLTTIWYIISGILALIISIFVDSFLIQFAIFVIVGTLLLMTTRKTLMKLFKNKNVETNLDRVVGMTGIVTEKIDGEYGEVKVDGKKWTAYSDEKIDVHEKVKVLQINGVKLKVKKEGK